MIKQKKYYNFKEVSDFFYNILINNSKTFEGLVKQKNILQKQNASGEANISVLTNWISLDEIKDELMCEDYWNDNYLGFGTLIQVSAGHEATSQDAFIVSTSIIQRLKTLLEPYGQGYSIKNDNVEMTIYSIDYASVTDPDNPTSDFAISICRIIGIWKSYKEYNYV